MSNTVETTDRETADPRVAAPSPLRKPIIIIGSPRSGTTFISSLLKHHSQLAFFDEPRLVWRYGNDRKSDMLSADDARPDVIRHIRHRFSGMMTAAGKARMLEKTPANSVRVEFVDRVFPDARFVHVIRNGIDAVLSIRQFWIEHARGPHQGIARGRIWQRLREVQLRRLPFYAKEVVRRFAPAALVPLVGKNVWGVRVPGIEQMLAEMDLLDVCCMQWRMCVETACQQGRKLPANRYLEYRQEDLTPELVKRVLAFCELDEEPAVWDAFHRAFDPSRATGRKDRAENEDVRRIRGLVAPTMSWLGDSGA